MTLTFVVLQVLIHGSIEATQSLAEYCRTTAGMVQGTVFTPLVGELVDATTESHIFQVTLQICVQWICDLDLLT